MDFANMLSALAEESVRNIPQDKLDYINDDGLLCCGKCKTPKQVSVDFISEIGCGRCGN